MILGLPYNAWIVIVWFVIGFFGVGTWYEMTGGDADGEEIAEAIFVAALWPVGVAILTAFGVLWTLSWIPRGPARLVIWLLNRPSRTELPEARAL